MVTVDAVFKGPEGNPRFFTGDTYRECKWSDGQLVGYTRKISQAWPGMPRDMHECVDASFVGPEGNPRFFGPDSYLELRWSDGNLVGAVRKIAIAWPGLAGVTKVDAVFKGPEGNPRLFVGDTYRECRWSDGQLVGEVRKFQNEWPGLAGVDRVDACFEGPEGNPRFFAGDTYRECAWKDGTLIGEVRPITVAWPGLAVTRTAEHV